MNMITEGIAKVSSWPCEMCINGKIIGGERTGYDFCQKCRKEDIQLKPSEFHLRKSIDMERFYL